MVHEVLHTGRDYPTSGKDLCQLLNISLRELTAAITTERRAGHPICASTDGKRPGYYLAADKSEMEQYCNCLYHRAGEIHKTRNACKATIDKLPDPEPFEGYANA